MSSSYKVVFFYPDRQIEEVDELFFAEEKALVRFARKVAKKLF